ncbi:MAG TPA: right-handed parallel beta-helix repeat-containing protein [Acidimicrobiales bacterium]
MISIRRSRPSRPRAIVAPLTVAIALLGATLAGCGSDAHTGPTVLRVPADYRTIQAAVTAAHPGDLVLISPGTYREAVKVGTKQLVIRGTDRNRVVLEGGNKLINGFEVTADQVAIENLTIQRFALNGIEFRGPYDSNAAQSGPVGWRASYVTAADNGLYGFYAFGSSAGQFDHDYASGQPDSGIYVGQCRKCGAVVIDNTLEHNAIGYENTNASGVLVARNIIRRNRVGMTVNSGQTELLAPQRGDTIVANLVTDNDDADTPETKGGFGVGIALAGGQDDQVRRNVVSGNSGAGIVLIDQDGYRPKNNTVIDNVQQGNGVDLVFATSDGSTPVKAGNCFTVTNGGQPTTRPRDLLGVAPCDEEANGPLTPTALDLPAAPKGVSYQKVPLPKAQADMPGSRTSWHVPRRRPKRPDPDTLSAPKP